MPSKRSKPEQIMNLFRRIEVENANGKTPPQAALRWESPNRCNTAEEERGG